MIQEGVDMMLRSIRYAAISILAAAVGLFFSIANTVYATAIASSDISFFNLQITPSTGTVQFLDDWTAEAFAQAQNSLGELATQFDSKSGGSVIADAMVTFAEEHGFASALDITASTTSKGSIPGTTTAHALSKGTADLFNSFMIVGGTGLVDVSFSVDITGSLDVFTDAFGLKAEAETIFALEVDGSPAVFDFELLSVGPSSSDSLKFSESLFGTMTLLFDTPSFLFVSLDPESEVINRVSEPGSVLLMLAGLIALTGLSRRKA
jgi:hypothetical protein